MAERRITYDNELEIMIEDYLANPLEAELERVIEGLEEEELAERRAKVQQVLEGTGNGGRSHPSRIDKTWFFRTRAPTLCYHLCRQSGKDARLCGGNRRPERGIQGPD